MSDVTVIVAEPKDCGPQVIPAQSVKKNLLRLVDTVLVYVLNVKPELSSSFEAVVKNL